jgi:WD40 repeat protein
MASDGDHYYPLWTPDSRQVVFCCHKKGEEQWHLVCAAADGSGKPDVLYSSEDVLAPYSWSPDGKRLALYDGQRNISVLSLDAPRELEPVVATQFGEAVPAFSPDGQWLAYTSDRDGEMRIFVQPYPAMDRIIPISRETGEEPLWSPRGDSLFYRSRDTWMVVPVSTKPEFVTGTPDVVFRGPYVNPAGLSYDVAADGERFLVLKPQYDDSQVRELYVVTNWFEELKRLAPSPEVP